MTIQIDTDNKQLSEKILWLLSHFKDEGLIIHSQDTIQRPKNKVNIFQETKGILQSSNIDPLVWQNDIRNEWE